MKALKQKIFDICKLIYEEQKEAGAQLLQIERKIEQLKVNFKMVMLHKKGYFGTEEELDAMFEFKNNQNSQIFAEVKDKISEIKKRNIYNKLEEQLSKIKIEGDQNGKDTKTIKDKLMANPLVT